MRNIWGLLAVGVLALTACSAPVDSAAPAPVATETVAVTAAPIPAQAAAPSTTAPENDYGDMTQDEFYLAGISTAWRGERPTDTQFIAAARLTCDQVKQGKDKTTIRAAAGTGEDADWNNDRVVQYAIQVYCPS